MATLFLADHVRGLPDVLVFGSGTVGQPIHRHLEALGAAARLRIDIPWIDHRARRDTLRHLGRQLRAHPDLRGLRTIWAAGAAGFSATAEEIEAESAAFDDVLGLVEGLADEHDQPGCVLHMVSSAGGLYEGRTVRAADEPPSPLRAYGELKMQQERRAMRLGADAVVVHRPSSIFTGSGHAGRPGLIGAMVANAASHRPTTIYGSPTTLRDYVHADDVGRHIATAAMSSSQLPSPQLLVSGRPASIHEVVGIVESAMRRRVFVRYADPWNTRDIVFTRSARAPGFNPATLQVGVRRVQAEWLTRPRDLV